MSKLERRAWSLDRIGLESRADGAEGGLRMIKGHAAVFGPRSLDLGGFVEEVAPGAFAHAIANDDVRALFNHNSDLVLGRNRSGTLRLSEDDRGLAIEIDPPDTQVARDLQVSIERGDVDQMSFGFVAEKERWYIEGDMTVRTLLQVRLYDVSPVTFPAYPDTQVSVRSADEILAEGRRSLEIPQSRGIPVSVRRRLLELDEITAGR